MQTPTRAAPSTASVRRYPTLPSLSQIRPTTAVQARAAQRPVACNGMLGGSFTTVSTRASAALLVFPCSPRPIHRLRFVPNA